MLRHQCGLHGTNEILTPYKTAQYCEITGIAVDHVSGQEAAERHAINADAWDGSMKF